MSALRDSRWGAVASLFMSSSTLVCCALPALLVALGAGAVLSGLIGAFPQIVWLSEHKVSLFAAAGVMLMASAGLYWRSRKAPCPLEPRLRDACIRARRVSSRVLALSVLLYGIGGWFAFVWPLIA